MLTSNLLVAQYLIGLSNFMLATMAALVVGKAVLVANKIPLLRRYDRAPLIQPILFKTVFYWVIVFFVRLLERFVHFLLEGNAPDDFMAVSDHDLFMAPLFRHFPVAVRPVSDLRDGIGIQPSLWPRRDTASVVHRRPSELQLNRRQRMRELLRLSRLADAHSREEFRDPTNPAYREVIDILQRLAR